RDGLLAAVFCQLIVGGEGRGVHCVLVPLRDEKGDVVDGVRIEDCGHKLGLNGVDNGRIYFDGIRVSRENLLDRYAQITDGGQYYSPIENENRRFFTMLGTLIQGRISVGGASISATKVSLAIAVRHAVRRRQFGPPDSDQELPLMDFRVHQRRLLPALARTYALHFAQEVLLHELHNVLSTTEAPERQRRALESRAAGTKALGTWHGSRTVQECREACGGAGYLMTNRLGSMRADIDVFTTFEGDNHVLLQLVSKGLLTDFSSSFSDLDQMGMVKFVAGLAVDTVVERTAVHKLLERLRDVLPGGDDTWDSEAGILDRQYHLAMLRWREEHILGSVARRLKRGMDDGMDAVAVFSRVQDHVIALGHAHVERLVLEAFVEKLEPMEDSDNKDALEMVCDLFALSAIEADRGWFMEHGRLSSQRSKAITGEVGTLCRKLRPIAEDLVDGFGVPAEMIDAEMLRDARASEEARA
ncbi:MAG: acyl-CoA oxidase, partial [Marmoricola sp.]|nr:acyl-CoA oxidase [Marmoricola sp.]